MSTATYALSCAICGKDVTEPTSHLDAKGQGYCHACIGRLHGQTSHARASARAAACDLCGDAVEALSGSALGLSDHAGGGKSRYCEYCLARLAGKRAKRKSVVAIPAATAHGYDLAFEQMLADVVMSGLATRETAATSPSDYLTV